MKTIPNPEFEKAEFALDYIHDPRVPVSDRMPERRIKAEDWEEFNRRLRNGESIEDLFVPPHLLVPE